MKISSLDGSFETDVDNVYSLHEKNFNVPGQDTPVTDDSKWNYVKDISFPDVKPEQVQVLIGADVPSAHPFLTKSERRNRTTVCIKDTSWLDTRWSL